MEPRWAFCPSLGVVATGRRGLHGAPLVSRRDRRPRASFAACAAADAQQRVERSIGAGPDVAFGAIHPVVRRMAAAFVVLGTGAASFTAASPRQWAPVAAGATGVAVAAVGVATLREGPKKAAKRALAKAVAVHGEELRSAVDAIPRSFGVPDEAFAEMKVDQYQLFLGAMLEKPGVSYGEVADLQRLKYALNLDGAAIGDAHYEAARAFYRENALFVDANDGDPEKEAAQAKLDKLIFLSDRMYADKDTEEAYRYERSRILRFFNMDDSQYGARFAEIAVPFYRDVVARAIVDSNVSEQDIRAAQAALGVDDRAAATVRSDAYQDAVEAAVQEKGKLDAEDNDKLARLRSLFDIEDDRASDTLKALASPVYRTAVAEALDSVMEGSESYASIYGRLALRQQELGLPVDAARATLAAEVNERAQALVRNASKFLRVQNIAGCVTAVEELLKFADHTVLLIASNEEDKADTDILREYMGSAARNLTRTEPQQMYRLYLADCLNDRKVDEEEEAALRRLRAVLGLKEHAALSAYRSAAGPVYGKMLTDAVKAGTLDDETKASIEKQREDLRLPLETAQQISVELYRNKLREATVGSRIIQESEAQDLFVLRQFLGLEEKDINAVHASIMGPIYEQSVTEAMGPTGILLDDYRAGLERLRDRLTLTQEAADKVFHKVCRSRMKVYVERAMGQLEKRAQFRGQSEDRDVGDDPNIKRAGAMLGMDTGGLTIELSNLVEFYTRNGLVVEEEVEVGEGEEKQTRKVQRYPITLRDEIPSNVYNELYKQYLVQCFMASTRNEKQRLFTSLDQLGAILGMTEDEISVIHSNIGSVIYKNYATNAIAKGPLAKDDVDFLANIEKMLSMKPDQCQSIVKEAKEARVSALFERVFNDNKVLPESVKKARDTAKELDVDIVADLKVSPEQRARLFGVEIDAAIDRGELTADNQAVVQEVRAALQVDEERARQKLLDCIQRRCLSHLVQAAASLRQERSETAVAELRTMLRYGKLLPSKVQAPAVSLNEKQELFLLFQAFVITDGSIDQSAKEQIDLLKTMFGFSDADLAAVV